MASLSCSGEENVAASVVRVVFNDEIEHRENATRFVLYLRVTMLRKVYVPYDEDGRTRYSTVPAWYFEALIDQPTFDPCPDAPAVRCYIDSGRQGWEYGLMQYINAPSH